MEIEQRVPNYSLDGSKFRRDGQVYVVLSRGNPGCVVVMRAGDVEPIPVFLMSKPKAEEIEPLGSVSDTELRDI